MAPGEYIAAASYSNYSYSHWYRAAQEMLNAARMAEHRAFVRSLIKPRLVERPDDKSISLLTKTVSAPKLRTHIRQPCWRIGRWRSVTGGKGRQTT